MKSLQIHRGPSGILDAGYRQIHTAQLCYKASCSYIHASIRILLGAVFQISLCGSDSHEISQ